jgi:hypothetical protein
LFTPAVSKRRSTPSLSIVPVKPKAVHQHADRPDDAGLVDEDLVGCHSHVIAAGSTEILDHGVQGNLRMLAAQATNFVVDNPACTGLPPGLLTRRTTPAVPLSPKASAEPR